MVVIFNNNRVDVVLYKSILEIMVSLGNEDVCGDVTER